MAADFPDGTYLSVVGRVRADTGGQTNAMLLRNRLLVQRAGISPLLVGFDRHPVYDDVRRSLMESGKAVPGMRILNLVEYYLGLDVEDWPVIGDALHHGSDWIQHHEPYDDDGLPFCTLYRDVTRDQVSREYRRKDGSTFLKFPTLHTRWQEITLCNRRNEPVMRWKDLIRFRQHWLKTICPPDIPVYAFCDSRIAMPTLIGLKDRRFRVIYVVHNNHVNGRGDWNSDLEASYREPLTAIPEMDAFVTLTQRQGEDIAQLFGATTNFHVVSNPVDIPEPPSPAPPREAMTFMVVARLEPQKRLQDAIEAFGLVVAEEPGATLHIYGDGSRRAFLEGRIEQLGLQDSVTLHGFDPTARDALWRGTAFLMTSRFEGYPLATLEAFARGCPVISYDIKYGPREQITDGVDGFVVPVGDVRGMADAMLRLARSPQTVADFSAAARVKAKQHDDNAFIQRWSDVLRDVVATRDARVTLKSVDLEVRRLSLSRDARVAERLSNVTIAGHHAPTRLLRPARSVAVNRPPTLDFVAVLTVAAKAGSPKSTAVITLDAVSAQTAEVVPIPLTVTPVKGGFKLTTRFDTAPIIAALQGNAGSWQLRLRLVWQNAVWETRLTRPRELTPELEVVFDTTGTLNLLSTPVDAVEHDEQDDDE